MAQDKKQVEQITDMEVDFAKWFTDVCKKAELIDYSSIKGMFILRPYGYAIWENFQKILDEKFKETGHENVYLPMLIPESLLQKEKDHVEGFAPECAWVTMGGSEKLEERYCIRPTSETLFCEHYANIIHSHRDLPKLYNQWCSVLRWEKTSRPFLRSLLQRLSYLLKNQSYFIAVGVLAENLHELYHSYQSAVISLQQNFFLGMNSISFAGESDASGYTPDDNFRKGLLSCVKQKDAEGCFRLLDSLYAAYQSHPSGLISMVREDYYACLSQLFQHCLAHRIDFQSASSQQLWDVISSAHTLKELHAIAVNLYQSYFDFVRENREEASVSGNIRRLVEENYGNPSLGLQFLSENLKLSQSYISQLFKQETGTTINQYIISFRIDMASSQLLKSDRKIADIALSCGFPDQNYFTKLFKKCTGMTPSEYRGYV